MLFLGASSPNQAIQACHWTLPPSLEPVGARCFQSIRRQQLPLPPQKKSRIRKKKKCCQCSSRRGFERNPSWRRNLRYSLAKKYRPVVARPNESASKSQDGQDGVTWSQGPGRQLRFAFAVSARWSSKRPWTWSLQVRLHQDICPYPISSSCRKPRACFPPLLCSS
ncbi:hypothetical protein V8C37DRAFT_18470 [Trichoderma ceciliae]